MAGFFSQGSNRPCGNAAQRRQIAHQPFADRLFLAAGPFALAGATSLGQGRVQRRERGRVRQRRHEGALGVLHQPFDLAFVVALARPAEAIPKQEMADQLGEGARAGTLAVAEDPGHRQLGVVVQDRLRHAAEKGKGRDVPVQEGFRRLRRIGLYERRVGMGQIEAEHMQHHAHAADDADALAEIDLGMAGRMGQRHKGLLHPHPLQPDVILHHRVAAGIPVFGPQPLENPLGRVPLLRRRAPVRRQDRVDHRHQRPQLRLLRWFAPLITRRNRKPAHLGDRVPAQPEHPRRLPPAVPLNQHIPANRRINLHLKHPQPSSSDPEKDSFSSGRLLRRHAAALCRRPVADYSTALFAPHPIPVSFWLDEFYALKRIPLVDQIGVVAGSKIEVIIVVQSFSMLKQLYSDAWEAFLGNAGAIILIGSPGDATTCDYLVRRSCGTSVVKPHTGTSTNPGGVGTSGGDAFEVRPTLTHADLYNLKPGTGFIWLHGMANPTPAVFPGYYTDPVLSKRARQSVLSRMIGHAG